MANIKISQLPSINNNLTSNALIPIVSTNGNFNTDKISTATLANYILSQSGTLFVSANVANISYNVVNAAQPNITSVGTLTGLTVVGTSNVGYPNNVIILGGTAGQVLSTFGNGSLGWIDQIGATGATGPQGDTYRSNSVSNLTIALGNISLVTEANLAYSVGQDITVTHDFGNYMAGPIITYDSNTGNLEFQSITIAGSGTYTSWDINLDGAVGAIGATGSTGIQGSTGPDGATGATGIQGVEGPTGATGSAGGDGATGATGATGSGATGATGVAGTDGATGASGPGFVWQGAWQPIPTSYVGGRDVVSYAGSSYIKIGDGNSGSAPPDDPVRWSVMAEEGAVGAQGATGATGPAGTNGSDGATGATGPQGDTGATGATGSDGATGPQGATGITPGVTQDITSNGNMSIMLYDGNLKYNNYATVEPVSGNINTSGNISVTGNITANNLGNISSINLDGSSSNVLYGNGVFAAVTGGNANTGNVTFNDINIIGTGNLHLQPDPADAGSYLDIFLSSGPDLHLVASAAANLILGKDDGPNVMASWDGNVYIQSWNTGTNIQGGVWNFGEDGSLTLPGNLVIAGNYNVFGANTALIQPTNDLPLIALSSGPTGAVSSIWVEDIGNVGTSNIAAVYANPTPGSGIVRIVVGQNGGNAGPYLWDFNANGTLTFPGTPRIDTSTNNFEVQAAEAINFEANTVVNIYTDAGNNAFQWQFGDDGLITLPGGNVSIGLTYGSEAILASNVAFGVVSQGSAGMTALQWTDDVSNTSQFSAVYINDVSANVGDIQIRTGAIGNANIWKFGNDGNLNFPRDVAGNTDPYLVINGGSGPSISSVDVSLAGPANLLISSDYLNLTGYNGNRVFIRADDGMIATDANIVLSTNNANVGNTYSWTFGTDGNLTLAGGNSVIYSIANSSLDPTLPNVSTMTLTPDANYNSQVLVLDPTAPGHIHLRAYAFSNIDDPAANIFLGGEDTAFEITQGANNEARIHSGGNTWVFTPTGSLNLATGNSVIQSVPNNAGDSSGLSTLNLIPDNSTGDDRYIIVDPTGPNHIHIRAGGAQDGSNSLLFLGGEQAYTRIDDFNHEVQIGAYDSANTTGYSWSFGNTGTLTIPGNLVASGASPAPSLSGFSSLTAVDYITVGNANIYSNGAMTGTDLTIRGSNTARIGVLDPGFTFDTYIQAENNLAKIYVANATQSAEWQFTSSGNLTLPGNTVAINFANNTAAFGNISALNLNGSNSQVLLGNGTYSNISVIGSTSIILDGVSGPPNNWTANYTGSGGRLLVMATGSAYSSGIGTYTWALQKNGVNVATSDTVFNSASFHLALNPINYVDTSGNTSSATWSLVLGAGLTASAGDDAYITIIETTGITDINTGNITASGNINVGGSLLVDGNVAVNGPAFSAYASAGTSITGSDTKVNFQTEEFDTNNNYNTSTSRFTPTVAGYYQVTVSVMVPNTSAVISAMIYKNGSKISDGVAGTGSSTFYSSSITQKLVYMNGTTDYLEGYAICNSTLNTFTGVTGTYFQASMVRGA